MKKGQALVEFVIILPIFLFLLLGVIDVGRIMYTKVNLENTISDVVDMYEQGKTKEEITNKVKENVSWENNNDMIDISINKEVDIITPGFNLIFGNPYNIEVKRSILNEA